MATGLQEGFSQRAACLRLVEGTEATIAAPTIVDAVGSQGVAMAKIPGPWAAARDAVIFVYATDGTGAIALAYVRLWGWVKGIGRWFPVGSGTDANKGKINVANTYAMGVIAADRLGHCEPIVLPGYFDRLYAEVNSPAGTGSPSFNVDLLIARIQDHGK